MRLLILLTLASLLTSACGTRVLNPTASLEKEVADLRNYVIELQKKAAVSEVELSRLREKVALLEQGGGSPSSATSASEESQATRADAGQSVSTFAGLPQGVIEESELRVDSIEPAARRDVPPRPAGVAISPSGQEASDSTVADVETVNDTSRDEPLSAEGQRLYDDGYTLYHRGQYLDAEATFQEFLRVHPQSSLADNARYWIGESRYARRDYRGALAAFRETVNLHPLGNKVPDALLKAGQSLEMLGDKAAARQSYREIQRRFPDSAAALVATDRIEALS